eukprot:Nitzschia sp. Nitz4//scaffold2_size372955//172653//174965//NITZ4_000422-RA/size372955-processed-gene-0.106-mRNA-1//-1//CDS//3329546775//6236//frame0
MVYPSSEPTGKHDLVSVKKIPPFPASLLDSMAFSNSTEILHAVQAPLHPPAHTIAFVYSFPDAPDLPGPLSRVQPILGVADASLSFVRKLVGDGDGTYVPDCLHPCTLAVRKADAAHMPQLEPRHQKNSKSFAMFIKQLRKDQAVAILGQDKHGRFGLLVPVPTPDETNHDSSNIQLEDCMAQVYVGDVNEVVTYLTSNGDSNSTSLATPAEATTTTDSSSLWQPPGADDSGPNYDPPQEASSSDFWQPPGAAAESSFSAPWETSGASEDTSSAWDAPMGGGGGGGSKRSYDEMNAESNEPAADHGESKFHADSGAAAADAFYSGLTRSLDTRADSYLYHMRAFNGWVKATQIQELDPIITVDGRPQRKGPLRVLDLACGKGGDLTKWTLHPRGMKHYVGIDVARGSLKDAAIRAREMRKRKKLSQAIFTVADLGADVPGRKKTPNSTHLQKLLTWSLTDETEFETGTPEFSLERGGGVSEKDRFDVVSIQFAIHYMMSSRQRARRFFHTVSELLEVGGNLICTTIDARVVIGCLMDLGLNYHFKEGESPEFSEAVVEAGAGACKIRFEPEMVRRIFESTSSGVNAEEDLFGLQYTFTLVEGSDHAAGVGDAVNLPEWLTPLPVLQALAKEAGLELDYAQNFHEFYQARKDPSANPAAHLALYNMKVLNRSGSISEEEWSVSRLYAAIKFRKVRESTMQVEADPEDDEDDGSDGDTEEKIEIDPILAKKLFPLAMINAKKKAGAETWQALSTEEKNHRTQLELQNLVKKS